MHELEFRSATWSRGVKVRLNDAQLWTLRRPQCVVSRIPPSADTPSWLISAPIAPGLYGKEAGDWIDGYVDILGALVLGKTARESRELLIVKLTSLALRHQYLLSGEQIAELILPRPTDTTWPLGEMLYEALVTRVVAEWEGVDAEIALREATTAHAPV
jgi:hypothetical protein